MITRDYQKKEMYSLTRENEHIPMSMDDRRATIEFVNDEYSSVNIIGMRKMWNRGDIAFLKMIAEEVERIEKEKESACMDARKRKEK
jgi:hypothetical protein